MQHQPPLPRAGLDLVAPLPQALVDVDAALELDVRPLQVARDLADDDVALVLAARGINKDEKLIRDSNRLR